MNYQMMPTGPLSKTAKTTCVWRSILWNTKIEDLHGEALSKYVAWSDSSVDGLPGGRCSVHSSVSHLPEGRQCSGLRVRMETTFGGVLKPPWRGEARPGLS